MHEHNEATLPVEIRIPDDVLWQQVEDQVVLLDLRSGEYHALNESGSRMWVLLVESGDASAALERLCAEYDATRATLSCDLAEFIAALVDRGLLEAMSP